MRSRDAIPLRSADFDVWDCSDYLAAAVPVLGLQSAVNLMKLAKIHVLTEVLAHRPNIGVELVARHLIAARGALPQIGDKGVSGNAVPSAEMVGDEQLRFAVNRKPDVNAAPLAGVRVAKVRLAGVDEAPKLIHLHVPGRDVLHSGVQYSTSFGRCRGHQRQNRVLVQSSEPRDRADAHALKHHGKGFRSGLRVGVVRPHFGSGFGERYFAGNAAIPLNAALSVGSKPADYVITTSARHGLFPLAFSLGKAQNQVDGREIGLPGFCLAPTSVSAEAGALRVNGLWWFDTEFHREPAGSDFEFDSPHRCTSRLKRSALVTQGVSYWTQEKSSGIQLGQALKGMRQGALGEAKSLQAIRALNLLDLPVFLHPAQRGVDGRHRIRVAGQVQFLSYGYPTPDLFRRERVSVSSEDRSNCIHKPRLSAEFFEFQQIVCLNLFVFADRGERTYSVRILRHGLLCLPINLRGVFQLRQHFIHRFGNWRLSHV